MCFISVEIEIRYSVMVHQNALKSCKNRPPKPLLYIIKLINKLTFDLVRKEYFVSMRGWLSGATAETNDALMRQLLLAIVSTAWIKISSTFSFTPQASNPNPSIRTCMYSIFSLIRHSDLNHRTCIFWICFLFSLT